VHTVAEDEAPPASADPRIRVASSGLVILVSLAVGLYVGAIDGDCFTLHPPLFQQRLEEPFEALVYSFECFRRILELD